MSLINADVDNIIVSYLFCKSDKWSMYILKKIYITFGRSIYNDFIIKCKNKFFELLFNKYNIHNYDIDELIKKVSRKQNIKWFPCYIHFNKNLNNSLIKFEQLKTKHRLIVYYLALFNGYIFVCTKNVMYEKFGYGYDKLDPNTVYNYKYLKQKRNHNLKYFDLVEKGRDIWNNKYKLKKDAMVYKKDVTIEIKDLDCIKIF